MKKLCLLVLLIAGFARVSSAQNIQNNTGCDIRYEVICYTGTPCVAQLPPTSSGTIFAGTVTGYALCSGQSMLHFWFANGCNANDPFVMFPGNCYGQPSTGVMTKKPQCDDCPTSATITYAGNNNWVIN